MRKLSGEKNITAQLYLVHYYSSALTIILRLEHLATKVVVLYIARGSSEILDTISGSSENILWKWQQDIFHWQVILPASCAGYLPGEDVPVLLSCIHCMLHGDGISGRGSKLHIHLRNRKVEYWDNPRAITYCGNPCWSHRSWEDSYHFHQ